MEIHVCDYGCNQEAKIQLKNGKWCCSTTYHKCPNIRLQISHNAKKVWETRDKLNLFKTVERSLDKILIKPEFCEFGCGNFSQYQLKNGKWCCSKSFNSCLAVKKKNSIGLKNAHKNGRYSNIDYSLTSWAKGLTKENDPRIKKQSETYKQRIKSGEIIPSMLGKHLSEEARKKISDKMKIAHAEGRAHNIGECRWNNEPSYPEKFMMKVIENEFSDKNYIREYPITFNKTYFSIDFAWPQKMRAIEIDGGQHDRFDEQKERDKRKDIALTNLGWTFCRISWKDFCNNTKNIITQIKSFIDECKLDVG